MTGGKRRRLVEEEQFGITRSPDCPVPLLEVQAAADPAPRHPSPGRKRAVVAMETSTAVPEQKPAGGIRKQVTEWIDAVGKRHGAACYRKHVLDVVDVPAGTRSPFQNQIIHGGQVAKGETAMQFEAILLWPWCEGTIRFACRPEVH